MLTDRRRIKISRFTVYECKKLDCAASVFSKNLPGKYFQNLKAAFWRIEIPGISLDSLKSKTKLISS
jgi:hypothetical protein